MAWFRRIFLFILVNVAVMFTITLLISVLGLWPRLSAQGIDYPSLMGFCLIWGMGGSFISLLLSKVMVKWTMGVQVIDPENPGSPEAQWLVDTVHRLAKNAGLTHMPEVGIYQSPDPNAFATGPGKDSSLVSVSTGLFSAMGKDEIEGVLGHELTHVNNGDMVTMTLVQGVVNSFAMFLAYVATFFLTRSRDGERSNNFFLQYMLRQVLEIVLCLFGAILVTMPFSRWREFRADAGGAQLAGKNKMINALKALQRVCERPAPAVQEPASMNAFKISSRDGGFMALLASHPPLEKRIAALETGSTVVGD
jgi:heat shock protein HtpX